MRITEDLIAEIMYLITGELYKDFPVMKYSDAINTYGSDKPDTRFDMKLINITHTCEGIDFKIFENIQEGIIVKAIVAKNLANAYSRKKIDSLNNLARSTGAKSTAYFKYNNGFESGISKYIDDVSKRRLKAKLKLEDNDLVIMAFGKPDEVNIPLGHIRKRIADDNNIYDKKEFDFKWIVDWPMFEYSSEDKRFYSVHHPFTMVKKEHIEMLETHPDQVTSQAYDLVVQGIELGGGSIRIHNPEIQNKIFKILGMDEHTKQEQFGFFLEALKYGTPPHGGIALGLDRIVMMLVGTNNIQDVIPFPKTNSGKCLMTSSPSKVSSEQLNDLNLVNFNFKNPLIHSRADILFEKAGYSKIETEDRITYVKMSWEHGLNGKQAELTCIFWKPGKTGAVYAYSDGYRLDKFPEDLTDFRNIKFKELGWNIVLKK